MRRRERPRVPNLRLVQPGPRYRPSPALSERPEVVAAFERGRRDAATSSFPPVPEAALDELLGESRAVLRAYLAGTATEVSAPAPLPG